MRRSRATSDKGPKKYLGCPREPPSGILPFGEASSNHGGSYQPREIQNGDSSMKSVLIGLLTLATDAMLGSAACAQGKVAIGPCNGPVEFDRGTASTMHGVGRALRRYLIRHFTLGPSSRRRAACAGSIGGCSFVYCCYCDRPMVGVISLESELTGDIIALRCTSCGHSAPVRAGIIDNTQQRNGSLGPAGLRIMIDDEPRYRRGGNSWPPSLISRLHSTRLGDSPRGGAERR